VRVPLASMWVELTLPQRSFDTAGSWLCSLMLRSSLRFNPLPSKTTKLQACTHLLPQYVTDLLVIALYFRVMEELIEVLGDDGLAFPRFFTLLLSSLRVVLGIAVIPEDVALCLFFFFFRGSESPTHLPSLRNST